MNFKHFLLLEQAQAENWQSYVNENQDVKIAVEILTILEKLGGKAYIVGGAVRDIVLGLKPKDVDIATNVPMDVIEKNFKTHNIGKNKDFGIVVIDYKGMSVEVAQFRSDGKYLDGRRPESVEIVSDFQGDAARRDFTINALGIDKDGNILDYFDGMKDIQNKVLKTVGNAHERFGEDYLRMMRAPRFAARLGFTIEPKTLEAIQHGSENIKKIAMERVYQEFEKMAGQTGEKFAAAVNMLDQTGLLQHIIPELYGLKFLKQDPTHHPESPHVLGHILEALKTYKGNDTTTNLAILFHDIGKGVSYQDVPGQEHKTFHGHEGEAVPIIMQIATRLKMNNATRDAIIFAAENHMRFSKILEMKPSKVAKLVADKNWDLLVKVVEADWKSRGPSKFDPKPFQEILDKVEEIKNKYSSVGGDAISSVKKAVNGELIMKLRNMAKPSKEIGIIQNATIDYIMNNNIDLNDSKKIAEFIKNYKF